VLHDRHQAPGIVIRKRVEESCFQQGENRRVAADAQGKHQHDQSGNARVTA